MLSGQGSVTSSKIFPKPTKPRFELELGFELELDVTCCNKLFRKPTRTWFELELELELDAWKSAI